MINEERLKKLREIRLSGGNASSVSGGTTSKKDDRISRLRELRLKQIEESKPKEVPQPVQEVQQPQETISPQEVSIWNKIKSLFAPVKNTIKSFQSGMQARQEQQNAILGRQNYTTPAMGSPEYQQQEQETRERFGKVGNIAADIARIPITFPTTVLLTLTEGVTGQREIKPSNKFEEAIIGKNGVSSYTKSGADLTGLLDKYAQTKGINIDKKFLPVIGSALSSAEIGLDFWMGGGKGKAIESIVKATTEKSAKEIAEQMGLDATDDVIRKIMEISDKGEAKKFADEIAKAKLAQKYAQDDAGVSPDKADPKNFKSADDYIKAQETPKVEIKSTPDLYPSREDNPYVGELAGKPTGNIKHEVIVNGKVRGKIFQTSDNRFQVTSDSVLGKYKAKYFKTLDGAKNFIANAKEKYLSLTDVDLMTGERKINGKTKSQLTDIWNKANAEKIVEKPKIETPKKSIFTIESEHKVAKEELKKLNEDKKKFVDSFVNSKEGENVFAELERKIMDNAEYAEKANMKVISGIKNSPYYRKEKSIMDGMGEGYLMEKNGKYAVSKAADVKTFEKNGWERGIEIDSLANEAGFERGDDFLEFQLELAEKGTKAPSLENLAKSKLENENSGFRKMNDRIESLRNEIKEKQRLLNEAEKTFEKQKETFAMNKEEIIEVNHESNLEAAGKGQGSGEGKLGAGKREQQPTLLPESSTASSTPHRKHLPIKQVGKSQKELKSQEKFSKSQSYDNNIAKTDKKSIADADKVLTSPLDKNPENAGLFKRLKKAYIRKWVKIREVVQDDWIRVKNLQRDKNVNIDKKALNPYEAEVLMHGRISARIEDANDIVQKIDKDILETSKKIDLPDDEFKADVYDYLVAKHAPERNKALGENAAGITTKEAEEILGDIKAKPYFAEVERVAKDIKNLSDETLEILYDSEVIDDDLYKTLREKYKEHIPLNRIMDEGEDIAGALTSRGLSVKGSGIKRAKGSQREIDDILLNVVSNYKQAVIRAEKNRVNLSTLKFARDNKHIGIFKEVEPPMIPVAKVEHRAAIDKQFHDELAEFAKKLFGKTQTKGQVGRNLGYYTPANREITRHFGTPREVQSHETAHHIDEMFGLKNLFVKRGQSKEMAQEMLAHMERSGESKNRMKKLEERFADSFEWWLTHRDLAHNDLPLFSEKIESIIKEIPELKPLLDIRPRAGISVERMDEVIFRQSPFGVTDPSVLTIREKGKPVYLKIKDEGLATAFQGLGKDKLPEVLKFVGAFTRFFSGLATRFNPEFAFSNKIRDLQEMAVYMASEKGIGFTGAVKTTLRDSASMKGVTEFVLGKDTAGAKLYKQMMMDGGTTGGMSLSTRKQLSLDLESIQKLNRSNPKKAAKYFIEKVDQWNTIFEDSTRLSVYKTSLDKGMTREEAALLAKNATLNFNKKGTGGSIINSLYMFSNASIQGSAKLLKAMKNPKVAGAVVGSVGVSTWTINKWNDSVDENWREKVDKWDRNANMVVMYPTDKGAKYFTIPVSWGLKPIKVAADYSYDAAAGKLKGVKEVAGGLLTSVFEAYNPVSGTDLPSAATPTILDVPSEIWRNKKWTGSQIHWESKKGQKESENFYKDKEGNPTDTSASFKASKYAAEKLSKFGVEFSPNDIKYAYEQYIGGAGRAVVGLVETVTSAAKGELPQAKNTPFVKRFYKEKDEEEIEKSKVYGKKDDFFGEVKSMPEGSEKTKYIQDYIRSFPEEERSGKLYGLMQEGVNTKGVSSSENSIRAKELAKKWDSLSANEKGTMLKEERKRDSKFLPIFKEALKERNMTQDEIDLKNSSVQERAVAIKEKIKDMEKTQKTKYLVDLKKKGILTDSVIKKIKQL